jgi:hypothetical protein
MYHKMKVKMKPQITVPESESNGFFTFEPPQSMSDAIAGMVARLASGSSLASLVWDRDRAGMPSAL